MKLFLVVVCLTLLSACATGANVLVTGETNTPTQPESVRVYWSSPSEAYSEIGMIEAKPHFALTESQKREQILSKLKVEAAKLGADAIIIFSMSEQTTGYVNTSDDYSVPIKNPVGKAIAINFTSPD